MFDRPQLPEWHTARPGTITPDFAAVRAWLDAYVRAWKSWDPAEIADLWTEDSVWIYLEGVRATGREAITAEWLAEQSDFTVGGYDAHYEPIAIDDDIAVTHGRTWFFDPETGALVTEYDNIWVLRFGPDGRCSEFHEWFARVPNGSMQE
jgi:uncharacterized protein (TIGR02246 family)